MRSIFSRLRHPRSAPDLSWLDRKDGLDTRRPRHADRFVDSDGNPMPEWLGGDLPLTNIQVLGRDRYAQCDETCTADCGHCKGRRFGPYAIPLPTRYDAEWPDVRAAEAGGWAGGDLAADPDGLREREARAIQVVKDTYASIADVGGDLAAMAAPLTDWGVDWRYVDAPADLLAGMARDDLGTYAEPVEVDPLYQVGPDGMVTVLIEADVSRFRDEMAHAARTVAELTETAKPRGRHRQTGPLDLILADLRDLDGLA